MFEVIKFSVRFGLIVGDSKQHVSDLLCVDTCSFHVCTCCLMNDSARDIAFVVVVVVLFGLVC